MLRVSKSYLQCFSIVLCFTFQIDAFSQKYEIVYMQFDEAIDTSKHEIPPYSAYPDTLAKWVYKYAQGKSLIRQTDDSQYERKRYYLNKETRKFDDFTFYNMSRNNIQYNDYLKGETRNVSHFFDIRYIIEDKLPHFDWKLFEDKKTILNYSCKRASARYPVDKNLLFDVWYTEDIAALGGPMDLNGLPGFILEVSRNGQPFYKVLTIEKLLDDAKVLIEKPLPNEKALTLSEYQKIRFGVPFINENTKPPGKDSIKKK